MSRNAIARRLVAHPRLTAVLFTAGLLAVQGAALAGDGSSVGGT